MSTTTTNMGLKTPAANDTDYPASVSDSFTAIDTHDHSSGKGVQVVTGGITDLAVTTAKINDLAVTTGKLAAGAVTQAKRAAAGQQVSSSSGVFSTTNSVSEDDVTNLSVTITTTGRPVFVGLIDDGASVGIADQSYVGAIIPGSTTNVDVLAGFAIFEDLVAIARIQIGSQFDTGAAIASKGMWVPPSSLWTISVPAAGSHTYKVKAINLSSPSNSAVVKRAKLIAYEL